MSALKILLLRVGMDLGYGGLGPLYPDGRFEYVPIPDVPGRATERSLYFREVRGRMSGGVLPYVPEKYRGGPAHCDPEFETFTYGDPTKNKKGQLLRLGRDDLLVFYAGLRPPSDRHGSKLYIIGYFVVREVHRVPTTGPWPPPEFEGLWANAHFRRAGADVGLSLVEGDKEKSRLLTYAVPLSDATQKVLPEMVGLLGLSGSVKRAVGRWVPDSHVSKVEQWLLGQEEGS